MARQMLKPKSGLAIYEICLINAHGRTVLVFEMMCTDDDEAIDRLFAIRDVPYARFEISCGEDVILQGLRCN